MSGRVVVVVVVGITAVVVGIAVGSMLMARWAQTTQGQMRTVVADLHALIDDMEARDDRP